jgi:hypothetical protein
MQGPYPLDEKSIDTIVTKTLPGNYALGTVKDYKFIVKCVGRSDTDINAQLKTWVGKNYTRFKFSYATSFKAAFLKECKNFHDFGGTNKLDNNIHPTRPLDTEWGCPVCGVSDYT